MKNKRIILTFQFTLSLLAGLFAQEVELPDITLFIEKPVAEQKIVITAEDIKEKNAESLTALLQGAGIQILAYGPYGLESKPSIRGFTDETVRVIIDGICVNNAQYGTFDFSSINVNDIEKIEIVKGGFTEGASDEGAVGGAIYITLKKNVSDSKIFSDTEIKSYFNFYAPLDTVTESLSYSTALSDVSFLKLSGKATFAQNAFLFNNWKNELAARENDRVIDGHGDIKYSTYFGDGYLFSIGDLFYCGHKQTPGSENSGNVGLQRDYNNNVTVNLKFPVINNVFKIENNYCWLSTNRFYKDAVDDSTHFVNSFKVDLMGEYFGNDSYAQSLSLSFDYTNLNSSNDGKHNQFTGTLKGTSKVKLGEKVSLSVPLAVKFCNENFAFIPKLGLKTEFKYFNLMVDGYRMIQFPNMDDLYWESEMYHGNPDLKPEKGWGGDVAISLKKLPFNGEVSLFTNYYSDKIQWAGNSPKNVASAFYLGVDFSLSKSFFEDKLKLSCNGEYLYNRLLAKSNSYTYGKRIMWTPDLTLAFRGDLKIKDFCFSLDGNFVGKRFTDNMNLYSMEPYLLLNCGGQYKKWQHFVPYFKIENLLNWDYEAVEDYPMPGISLSLGLKIEY